MKPLTNLTSRDNLKPYLCYVHRPDRRLADLAVITCGGDREVPAALDAALEDWPRFTRVEIYDGDRKVLTRRPAATFSRSDGIGASL